MRTQTATLRLTNYATYMWALAFTLGNVLLPELCHSFNLGGKAFLPIMFFTLIAAARFGVNCGMLTAVLSPLISMLLFGMPSGIMLAAVVLKSVIIALAAGLMLHKAIPFTFVNILLLVIGYQLFGFVVEGALFFGFETSWNDLLISYPGAAIQVVGLWLVMRFLNKA